MPVATARKRGRSCSNVVAATSVGVTGHIFPSRFVMSMNPCRDVMSRTENDRSIVQEGNGPMSYPSLIVMPVSNVEAAKAVYTTLLGIEPYADSAYYIGYRTGDGEIGLDPNASLGPLPYWDVDDLEGTISALTAAGATVTTAPNEVSPGFRIAVLADADGNPIGLRHTAK
jgi:predicted enzyme related to lactoylglutathione lyase